MKFLVVMNPIAGGFDKSGLEATIRAFFEPTAHSVDWVRLTGRHDDALLGEVLRTKRPDRVVAVGGDGTVKLVAGQLLGTTIPLAILPAGSANGMARELNIPAFAEAALALAVSGEEQQLDVILVNNDDVCLHLSDIGMNAQLVKYFETTKLRGKIGYARGILKVLLRRRPLRVRIVLNEGIVERQAFMVVLANARMYGTGAVINPDGDLHDGLFEVVVMRQVSFWEFLKMFWRYRPFDPGKIEILQATSVRIETRRRAYFQVDGEYRGRVKKVEATIRPQALRVIVPTLPD